MLETFDYLKNSKVVDELIKEFENSNEYDLSFKKSVFQSFYNPKKNLIKVLDGFGLEIKDSNGEVSGIQSQALGVLHEIGHAKVEKDIIEKYGLDSEEYNFYLEQKKGKNWPREENFVVKEYETPTAKELNEKLGASEPIRVSHQKFTPYENTGEDVRTEGPTSTKRKN